jgi:hypothetical protein
MKKYLCEGLVNEKQQGENKFRLIWKGPAGKNEWVMVILKESSFSFPQNQGITLTEPIMP